MRGDHHRDPEATPGRQAGLRALLLSLASSLTLLSAARGGDVWTYHNDNARTGQNLDETALTPATVNKNGFGKLFTQAVDGYVYAQPLYRRGVAVGGKGTHNVVFVATEHDSVYAFDADSSAGPNANPLWHLSFINPAMGLTTVPSNDLAGPGRGDIVPEVGITGTPVIDVTAGTLYVVAKTKQVVGGQNHYVQRLHALDVGTGAEKFGGPALLAETIADLNQSPHSFQFVSGPTVPGSGESNDGQRHVFLNALQENQRSGLALVNGVVYVAWAGHNDLPPFHGWVAGYDARTLKLVGVFNTTPNAVSMPVTPPGGLAGGGVWQAGGAPAADDQGALYFTTGNGMFSPAQENFGDSVLKLSLRNGNLTLADFFTPFDQAEREDQDTDLGSGGVLLLPDQPAPHPHLLVTAGKGRKLGSTIYLLDRDNLGKFHPGSDSQIVQSLPGAIGLKGPAGDTGDNGAFCTPAYFNNRVYYLGTGDVLKAFEVKGGKLSDAPVSGNQIFPGPGATPSISANGSSNGIVWVLQSFKFPPGNHRPAVLHAYDASDLTNELYNSNMAGTRDQLGANVKFTVPTVANGRVYVGTQSAVTVFGLLGH